MRGFECATHRRRDRVQIDVLHGTDHAQRCEEDYLLLAEAGVRTVRDGLRWHLIETVLGVYDWSSFLPMLNAAQKTRTQVLWDLCHWGSSGRPRPFSTEFPTRFAAFAGAAARLIRIENQRVGIKEPSIYCPINEISFWAWVGVDVEHFHPYGDGRGPDPWNFQTSGYESGKYRETLASLPRQQYRNALEIGCSIGLLTAQLAARCSHLLSLNVSENAINQARKRCLQLPQVTFAKMQVPREIPQGSFDLIMVSEIAYY